MAVALFEKNGTDDFGKGASADRVFTVAAVVRGPTKPLNRSADLSHASRIDREP
jgi:hypothetical protein